MTETKSERRAAMQFARGAYWYFLFWGVCSALGTTFSTLIDAILVGNLVGSDGLAVTSIATPVFLFYALLGMTLGVGANVKIGRALGSDYVEEANRIFHEVLLTGVLVGALCLAVVLPLRERMLDLLGAEDALRPLARQYLTVVFRLGPGLCAVPHPGQYGPHRQRPQAGRGLLGCGGGVQPVAGYPVHAGVQVGHRRRVLGSVHRGNAGPGGAAVPFCPQERIPAVAAAPARLGGPESLCGQRVWSGLGIYLSGRGDVHLQHAAAGQRPGQRRHLCGHLRGHLYHEYHPRRHL